MQGAAGVNMELADQLGKLMALREAGKISDEQFAFAQEQALAGTAGGFEGAGSGASTVNAGSQEAYQFIAGVQDRNFKQQMQQLAQQTALQKATVAALEKANQLLDEIAENPVGSAG